MVSCFSAPLKQHVSFHTVWIMVFMKQNRLPLGLCSVGTSKEVFPPTAFLGETTPPHPLSVSGGLTSWG